MKIGRVRKYALLIGAILALLFSGLREEWHSLSWFGIHIGYDYHFIVKEKMRIIAAIIVIAYVVIVMAKDD
ncbi:hypothetical protein BU251_07450 [Candidatus Velamenicoccus archaeovorus]|uniref:Uncharacterized protein n=1 Tax=Velamenicoccus archaeovorus TaxID=1930593 RepID=A0A410P638_VELA1|nr:hypothetical protein [Candidatus Velamenicoccus archaeovorus]QAT17562.1 hypothetical protein BU251_07450 [Candidatus Velamenicoccus archaeovorus]